MQVHGAGARRVWLQVGGGWVLLRQLHDSDEDVAWRNVLRRMHRHHKGPQAVDARTDAASILRKNATWEFKNRIP